MAEPDRKLFDDWRAGDQRAGELLFERHQRAIQGFFARRVQDAARDLAQETWLQCLKSHESYRGESSFRTFLFAVAHNLLRQHLRRTHRERDLGITDIAISQPSPSSLIQKRLEIALLSNALNQLPDEHRMVLEMVYDEQLSSQQIGELLELPSATVRTRLRRARELLRKGVAEGGNHDATVTASALEVLDFWTKSAPPDDV